MLPNIGPTEIVIILVVVLAVFGSKRLPELGSSLGKGIRGFGKGIKGEDEDEDEEPRLEAAVEVAPAPPPEHARV
jgi:sec-independent protein translocase protein TatA